MGVRKERGKKEKKEQEGGNMRDSPVQGAPASCRPGDGPDIASPLSSEKKRQKGMLVYILLTGITRYTVTNQKQAFKWVSTEAKHNVLIFQKTN